MFAKITVLVGTLAIFGSDVRAEFAKVDAHSEFVRLVSGKTLSRPFIDIVVTPDGRIQGTGARWEVTGQWSWQDGYFCRSLFWGGDDLGYNCQEVRAADGRLRFTSDQGAGRSAVFRVE